MYRTFLLSLLIIAAMLGGCASKPVATVSFEPYVPPVPAFQKSGTIYISGLVDKRKNPRVVGEIVDGGKVVTRIETNQKLDAWFREAIMKGLGAEGCNVTPKSTHHPKIARVYIRIDEVKAVLDRSKLTGENLTATVRVTLFMRQGKSERIIKKIGLTQKKWVPPLSGPSTVEAYLQETMREVVRMVLEHIDSYRF
ncbi:YajG family lipoprotein [Hydrogenimonas sp.]